MRVRLEDGVKSWSVAVWRFWRKFCPWISSAKANRVPLWLKKCLIQKRWEKLKIYHTFVAINLYHERNWIYKSWNFLFVACRVGVNLWRFHNRRMGKILQQFSSSNWEFTAGWGIYKLSRFLICCEFYFTFGLNSISSQLVSLIILSLLVYINWIFYRYFIAVSLRFWVFRSRRTRQWLQRCVY